MENTVKTTPVMDQKDFIAKYSDKLTDKLKEDAAVNGLKAKIVGTDDAGLDYAAAMIAKGELASFPTETVYGLGADALDEKAVLKIFEAKKRPLTDPVIIHITSIEDAERLLDITADEKELFEFVAKKFWPGPLTIVMKADLSIVPNMVTANTGYVSVRYPNHKIAQELIKRSKKAIAAPSANVFSHVSPTTAFHVLNDLYDRDFTLVFGEQSTFGIESTVVKIALEANKIYILRRGSLSVSDIKEHLNTSPKFAGIEVEAIQKKTPHVVAETTNTEAPGQFLKHYSPSIETYLVREHGKNTKETATKKKLDEVNLKDTVFIDFGKRHEESMKRHVLEYLTLSEKEDVKEAMYALYDVLRYAENVKGAKSIFILDLDNDVDKLRMELPDFLETLYDKVFRSASGKVLDVDWSTGDVYLGA